MKKICQIVALVGIKEVGIHGRSILFDNQVVVGVVRGVSYLLAVRVYLRALARNVTTSTGPMCQPKATFLPCSALLYLLVDDTLRKQCYEAAIDACSRAKKWECAIEIFRGAERKFGKDKTVLKPMFRSVLLAVRCTILGERRIVGTVRCHISHRNSSSKLCFALKAISWNSRSKLLLSLNAVR